MADVAEMKSEKSNVQEVQEVAPAKEVKEESSANSTSHNSSGGGGGGSKKSSSDDRKSSKEDKSKEDKSKEDKSKDERSKDDRSKEERSSSKRKSSRRSRSREKRYRHEPSPEIRAPSTRRVYIANVPYDARWQDIKDLFREKIGDCEFIHLFEDEDGKPRGCGLVEFKDPDSVQKALEVMHKFDYKGRKFVVKEDYDSERDRFGRIVKRSSSSSRSHSPPRRHEREPRRERERSESRSRDQSGVSRWVNTYGLSPQFLESLGITGPITNSVFVANLDYKVSSRKLREVFRMAGRVVSVNLNTDKDGNSRGHGVVTFEHPVEAVQAVSMFNGQVLNDRPLSVKIDRYAEEPDTPSTKLPSGLKGIGMGLGAGGQPLTNVTTALSSVDREPPGYWGSGLGEGGNNEGGFVDRGNGFADRAGVMDRMGGGHQDRLSGGSFHDRSSMGFGDREGGAVDRMGSGGDFGGSSDRGGGYQDRGGMGSNYPERGGSNLAIGGYSDRNPAMSGAFSDRGGGGSMMSERGSSVMNDRGGNLGVGIYPDRGGSMDSGYPDRGSNLGGGGGGGGSYQDRNNISGGFNAGSFGDRVGQYSARGGGAGGFADRSSVAGSTGMSFSDRGGNITSGVGSGGGVGMGPSGVGGLSSSAGMDGGRFDDYRRDFSRRDYSPATQENEYRNLDDSFNRQGGGGGGSASQSSVYVRNLPKGFSRLDLIDRFCEAGNIEFAKMSSDGVGLVCFSLQREAQRAIQLFDGSRVDGRVIEVAM